MKMEIIHFPAAESSNDDDDHDQDCHHGQDCIIIIDDYDYENDNMMIHHQGERP